MIHQMALEFGTTSMSPTWHRLIFWRFVISRMAAKAISSIWATASAILFGKLSKLQEPSPVIRFRQLNPREELATRQDWSHPARRQEKFWVGIRSTQVWKKSLAMLGDGTRIIRTATLKYKNKNCFWIHFPFTCILSIFYKFCHLLQTARRNSCSFCLKSQNFVEHLKT